MDSTVEEQKTREEVKSSKVSLDDTPLISPPIDILTGPIELPEQPIPGMLPIFLTSMTQDLFKIKTGVDVTIESPIKMIPKSDILSDLYSRAAVSDWFPVKPLIVQFPNEEILVHFDADFKYSQNFFICVTPEAVDAIIKLYVPKKAEFAQDEPGQNAAALTKKPCVSSTWVSQGSEKEIEMETIVPTREKLIAKLSRKRREFGMNLKLGDRDAHEGFIECRPYRDANFEINRMEIQCGTQAIPVNSTNSTQTIWNRPLNAACQYDPILMSDLDKEKILASKDIKAFCNNVLIRFEHAIQQNEVSNIFYDDLRKLAEDEAVGSSSQINLQEYQSFTELKYTKDKSISCIDWHPSQKGVLAVSYVASSTLDERIETSFKAKSEKSVILIWSFHDPIHPQLILEAPDDIYSFQFNPEDHHIIVAGCANGQIVLWDISEYQDKLKTTRKTASESNNETNAFSGKDKQSETPKLNFLLCSSIEASHRGCITDLKWLSKTTELGHNGEWLENSENGHKQFYTCSLDGTAAFWDLRYKKEYQLLDLTWRPFIRIPLNSMDNTFDYGLTKISIPIPLPKSLEIKPTNSQSNSNEKPAEKKGSSNHSTKFYCATEEGDLIYSDLSNDKNEDKSSRVEHSFSGHFGPMSDLQRSPFFPDIILSVGGWSFHIWREKINIGPLLSSGASESYIIAGRWSPTRPGVFYISRSDGSLEVWDLLDQSYSATTVQNVASTPVSHMSVYQYGGKGQGQQFIAAGDDEGTLHILEVPKNLSKPAKNEKAFVSSFFDREVKRLLFMKERKDKRAEEKSAYEQEFNAAVAKAKAEAVPPAQQSEEKKAEDPDFKEEEMYKIMEKEFLISQGLLVEEEIQ